MAYDKLVDSAKLDGALKRTADAIRGKTGGTENIPWSETDGFKSAVEGISGTAVPDGTNVKFGDLGTVAVAPDGKLYYNGILLPEFTAEPIDASYVWIQLMDQTSMEYRLAISPNRWFLNTSTNRLDMAVSCAYNTYTAYPDSQGWEFRNAYTDTGAIALYSGVIWANHDIPRGSLDSTDIYVLGSEVSKEVVISPPTTEYAEAYAISSADLNSLGAITQKMADESTLMTVADMIYWLNRVIYLPQGHATSELKLGSLKFESTATGM